jgi:branched-chain amino acid transport system permease protein
VRLLLLGTEWRLGKTAFLTGPSLLLSGSVCDPVVINWRIVNCLGLNLMVTRENAGKAAYVGVRVFRTRLAAFVISAVYGSVGGVILGVSTDCGSRSRLLDQLRQLAFMVLGGSQTFAGP